MTLFPVRIRISNGVVLISMDMTDLRVANRFWLAFICL